MFQAAHVTNMVFTSTLFFCLVAVVSGSFCDPGAHWGPLSLAFLGQACWNGLNSGPRVICGISLINSELVFCSRQGKADALTWRSRSCTSMERPRNTGFRVSILDAQGRNDQAREVKRSVLAPRKFSHR